MYPKVWFTYPKAWFIYPKPWDKLCAGVTPTFSGENVNLFCRRKKVKILVGLKRCPVGHNGRSARPFSQDGVCVSPWGVALLAHSLTFLTIGGFALPISGGSTLRKFGGAKLLITRRWPLTVRRAWLVASCGLLFIKTRLFAASAAALLKFWIRKCGKYFVGI